MVKKEKIFKSIQFKINWIRKMYKLKQLKTTFITRMSVYKDSIFQIFGICRL